MNHFIKFLGIGGIATLIQYLLLILLVEFQLAPAVAASACGFVLSSVFNYLANYHFTFSSNSDHRKTLPKFLVAASIGLATNTLLIMVFLYIFNLYLNYVIAQLLATAITVVLNFVIHKLWIYKDH